MSRTFIILAALFAATPALAAAPHFQAEPLATPAENRLVLRDTLWRCGAAGCAASASSSRPAIVCAVLAREVGALKSFTVAGQPLAPEALDKCNAKARNTSAAVQTAASR